MYSQKQHKVTSIRFRRWSRAGYAIFCSLACTVTIGCLAISISDKSLQKSVGVSSGGFYTTSIDDEAEDHLKQAAELEFAMIQAQEATLTQITVESTVVCGQHSNYNIFNQNG